jgi:hypothetical protein
MSSEERTVNPDALLQTKVTSTYRIVDDFLELSDYTNLVNDLLSKEFDWYHNHDTKLDYLHYFTHTFYTNYGFSSKYANKLNPFIKKINPASFVHIEATLFSKYDKVIEFAPVASFEFKHKCMLYFINANDGYTKLPCGTKLFSKDNRAVFFDVSSPYIDTTCTNDVFRMTMAFNYF